MLDRRIKIFMHVVFWAYLFLQPLQYMRGTGMPMLQYLMNCMSPLLLMIIFYANYMWLTPRYFAAGKHRYYLLINMVIVICFTILQQYWMDFVREMFHTNSTQQRVPDAIDRFLFIVRDGINFCIFATAATCIALAQRWYWAEKARNKAEAARSEAELKNLRNQINPHFLLNTLNNIYALTAFDTPKAQEAIQELSKMLRHILYDYQQPTVSLKDEAAFLENYVKLMRIRLPQSVEVTFNAQCGSNVSIAPMIFISLVENAFKHGVRPTEPSYIHISIEGDEDQITCEIRNSNFPRAAGDHSGHGIGLQQIQRRLELAYYEHYKWIKGVTDDGKEYYSRIQILDWKEPTSKLKENNDFDI